MRFIVHADIWDVLAMIVLGGFAVIYFVAWSATAWKERRKARK